MQGNLSKIGMFVALAALALPAAGQVRSRTSTAAASHITAAKTPYTAEYRMIYLQTLADGNTITHEDTEVMAIDSQGRRMQQLTTTRLKDQTPVVNVNVFDPVAKTDTRWSSLEKHATVRTLSTGAAHGCPMEPRTVAPSAPHSRPVVENLGLASIQGVEARGTRTTSTIPAGEVGNETPLVTTTEIWTAVTVGLKGLLAREIRDDPRSGKWTKELTSVKQEDPDPALFQPPPGYEIVTRNSSSDDCATESATKGAEPAAKDKN